MPRSTHDAVQSAVLMRVHHAGLTLLRVVQGCATLVDELGSAQERHGFISPFLKIICFIAPLDLVIDCYLSQQYQGDCRSRAPLRPITFGLCYFRMHWVVFPVSPDEDILGIDVVGETDVGTHRTSLQI